LTLLCIIMDVLSLTKILKKANSFNGIGNVKHLAHRTWFSGTAFSKEYRMIPTVGKTVPVKK